MVSSRFDSDEFDVDAIVELNILQTNPPGLVLDTLYKAIAGERGSRYHDMTIRHSRCVTVHYDEMHIDFTPAVLLPGIEPRTSVIFHANEEEPTHKHYHKSCQSLGDLPTGSKRKLRAAFAFDEQVLAKAATEPLPDQDDLNACKSLPLVALQLLKRWRNKLYDGREGRMPPSVMLAYYVAKLPGRRSTLLDEVCAQATNLSRIFTGACALNKLVHVANPRCDQDVLTDRWPGNLQDQRLFSADLQTLVADLAKLMGDPTMPECQRIWESFSVRKATAYSGGRIRQKLFGSSTQW